MTPPLTRDGDGIFVDDDGVKRRTILAGAAWSIPVISVATAAPAFAATTDLKLAFDKSSYSGEGCKTITGVKVTATRNSVAAPGESVTVTLADGYTFSDGSTSYTATTGSDGSITLPDIKVPAKGGSSTFSASGGGASASAPVSGQPSGQVYSSAGNLWGSGQPGNFVSIQTDGKNLWALDSDKTLWSSYDGGAWSKVTNGTDVTAYTQNGDGRNFLKGGKVYSGTGDLYGTDQPGTFTSISTDGQNVYALDSDKTLWVSTGGAWSKVSNGTSVTDYNQNGAGRNFLKGGKVYSGTGDLYGTDQPGTFTSIRTDGKLVWAIDSDKTLWTVSDATSKWSKVTNGTNVTDYSTNGDGQNFLKDGKVYSSTGDLWGTKQPGTFTSIQTDGKTVWALDSDKTLWTVDDGTSEWKKMTNGTNVSGYSLNGTGGNFLKPAC